MNSYAKNLKVKQEIEMDKGAYKLKQDGISFDVDIQTVTIRCRSLSNIKKKYKVLNYNKLGYVDLEVTKGEGLEKFIDDLDADIEIESIDFNTLGSYNSFAPNDPYFSYQSFVEKIKLDKAWSLVKGNSSVIVGVLDSGLDWNHEDIGYGSDTFQNIYLNSAEDDWTDPDDPSSGNGIDDDNNGFIDDWKGWNYADATNDVRTSNSHGTNVSGIIAAKTNNGTGISGIAGGNQSAGVKILHYCIGVTVPSSGLADDAIIDAVDAGVKIINISANFSTNGPLNSALDYAKNNNVLVVCASGNMGYGIVLPPASNLTTLAVGSVSNSFSRSYFSSYGNDLNIVASGENIPCTDFNNSYPLGLDGTSLSAPIVSAVAALLLSANSNLSRLDMINALESTAQKVGPYVYQTLQSKDNGTFHNEVGYGVVNAFEAIMKIWDCNVPMDFDNLTIDSDQTIYGCNIKLNNSTVSNSALLQIDFDQSVTLDNGFFLDIGSELLIQN